MTAPANEEACRWCGTMVSNVIREGSRAHMHDPNECRTKLVTQRDAVQALLEAELERITKDREEMAREAESARADAREKALRSWFV